jgi:hypothetical protein
LGWKRDRSGSPSGTQGVRPADAGALEAIPLPNKRESALRDAAEQYLNPRAGKAADLAGGFGVCMDLGLFYLDEGRLQDAEKLFGRLDGFKAPASYKMLGRLGRAVVLALESRAKESNALFHEVFPPLGRVADKPRPGKGRKAGGEVMRRIAEVRTPIKPVLDSPNWRYWIFQARWYNHKNGVAEGEVSRFLVNRFPLRAAKPAPGPDGKVRPDREGKK